MTQGRGSCHEEEGNNNPPNDGVAPCRTVRRAVLSHRPVSTVKLNEADWQARPCTQQEPSLDYDYEPERRSKLQTQPQLSILRRRPASSFFVVLGALCLFCFTKQQRLPTPSTAKVEFSLPRVAEEGSTIKLIAPFPRWNKGVISQARFLQRLGACLNGTETTIPIQRVYVVNNFNLLTMKYPLIAVLDARRKDMTRVMLLALTRLRRDPTRYPKLTKAITAKKGGGFAFAVDFGDAAYCRSDYFPIFTLAAPVNCNSSFPIPSYDLIRQTTLRTFRNRLYSAIYPWWIKKRAAIWRGSPTGPDDIESNKRVQLVEAALRRPDIMDASLTSTRWPNTSHLVGRHVPMYFFQLYRAILDVDGHSWSARFGSLLCMSSVVLKVEPGCVDYFYDELTPWVHYIPVRGDLSDLDKMVEYATSDANSDHVRSIIRNANDWCLRKFRLEALADDLLRIWNEYITYFDDMNVSSLLGAFDFEPESRLTGWNP